MGEIACSLVLCTDTVVCAIGNHIRGVRRNGKTHSLVRLALGVACKMLISSDASDAAGEAARLRLLLGAFTGTI